MFFNNSVDSIVRKLNRTIEQLNRLTIKLENKVFQVQEEIDDLLLQKDEFTAESIRASRIASKLNTLLQ